MGSILEAIQNLRNRLLDISKEYCCTIPSLKTYSTLYRKLISIYVFLSKNDFFILFYYFKLIKQTFWGNILSEIALFSVAHFLNLVQKLLDLTKDVQWLLQEKFSLVGESLTLINAECQQLLKAGLVGDYSPTTVGDLSPSPSLFCQGWAPRSFTF